MTEMINQNKINSMAAVGELEQCALSGRVSAAQLEAHYVVGELNAKQYTISAPQNRVICIYSPCGKTHTLDFNTPVLKFTGDADEAAKVFIKAVNGQWWTTQYDASRQVAQRDARIKVLEEALAAWKTEAEYQYGQLRLQLNPNEKDYPVDGALDACARGKYPALAALNQTPKEQP